VTAAHVTRHCAGIYKAKEGGYFFLFLKWIPANQFQSTGPLAVVSDLLEERLLKANTLRSHGWCGFLCGEFLAGFFVLF